MIDMPSKITIDDKLNVYYNDTKHVIQTKNRDSMSHEFNIKIYCIHKILVTK